MYFHRTVPDRTAMVWRRCDIDRWRCRPDVEGGVRLLGSIFIKKRPFQKKKIIWPKNLLSGLR